VASAMVNTAHATALTTNAEKNFKVAFPQPQAEVERAKVAAAMRRHLRLWQGRKDSHASPEQPVAASAWPIEPRRSMDWLVDLAPDKRHGRAHPRATAEALRGAVSCLV
jgi:hypothetical protein